MKVKAITAGFKEALNLGNYNSVSAWIELSGTLEKHETKDEAIDAEMAFRGS